MAPLWRVEVAPALVRCSRCGAPIAAGAVVARHAAVPAAVAHPACVGVAPVAPPVGPRTQRRRPPPAPPR